jgi:thiol-disulfide isomerase/thioredoxin
MGLQTHSSRKARFLVPALLVLTLLPITISAKGAIDSVNIVQKALPDSLSLKGKVVYVDFWASWCAPCRQSFPWLQGLYERYHIKGLEIVAVNVDKDHNAALKFLQDHPVGFTVVYDSTGALAEQFKLEAMPSSFVYDRDGHLVAHHLGFVKENSDSLGEEIQKLVDKGGWSE